MMDDIFGKKKKKFIPILIASKKSKRKGGTYHIYKEKRNYSLTYTNWDDDVFWNKFYKTIDSVKKAYNNLR